jgi:MerR family transcriptional regulator, light-induced transcriptional regulator
MSAPQKRRSSAAERSSHAPDGQVAEHHSLFPMQRQDPSAAQSDPPNLLEVIESEIIPRLMMVHRADPLRLPTCPDSRLPPSSEEIAKLARIAIRHDLPGALHFIEQLCLGGLSLEAVLLELVGPAARLLGEQWQSDQRSFTEVSAGLGTLQQVVHVLGPSFAPSTEHRGLVVLLPAPGEQHTLGLFLAAEFLRRSGWGVHVNPSMSESELLQILRTERVELVGISVSNDHLLGPLASLIRAIRQASCHAGTKVMLGGSLDLREFAAQHGTLFCTGDPREAVRDLEAHATVPQRHNLLNRFEN